MATERLSMRHVKEILRQKLELKKTHREVARAVGVSNGAVGMLLPRFHALKLTWDEVKGLDEDLLEQKIFGLRLAPKSIRPMPDMHWLHQELKKPGVTMELLHIEYLEKHPTGLRYAWFCECYKKWVSKQRISMRQTHIGGEKLFIDYSGKKPSVFDMATGEYKPVELFVACMGASSCVFAEATWSQNLADFVGSTTRAMEFFGGVPGALVIDNLKSGVTKANVYEANINRTYEEMAQHYSTAVLAARPYKPKDKAKVEVSVQVVQRWILARLRNQVFHSLGALNEAISELVSAVNLRVTKHLKTSRQQLFESVDKPALKPLPATRFEVSYWKMVRANIDYHVDIFGHRYSVPYALRGEVLESRTTATTVEIFLRGKRMASHVRSYNSSSTTDAQHMPPSHRTHAEWTPSRFLHWASEIGPMTKTLVESILTMRKHAELGFRSCLGILNLSKKYGNERLEKACARTVRAGGRSYRHVATILEKGLESLPLAHEEAPPQASLLHENLRGSDYYH